MGSAYTLALDLFLLDVVFLDVFFFNFLVCSFCLSVFAFSLSSILRLCLITSQYSFPYCTKISLPAGMSLMASIYTRMVCMSAMYRELFVMPFILLLSLIYISDP